MELYLASSADVHRFFIDEVWPRAEGYAASEESTDHVMRADGVGVVGYSGVGKERHDKLVINHAASLGRHVILGEQLTTRPPRTKDEENGKSAYTHLDLREPQVRAGVIRDLDERNYVQTHVWKSREFNADPRDLEAPAQPTHLYMTSAETFSLEPGTTTLVEYVLSQTEDFVDRGLLRMGMVMFATTQYRWLQHYYAREGKWPDNHSTRLEHAIDSTIGTRALVEHEDEMGLAPEDRKWLLLLNDYLDGKGLAPAYVQMYRNLFERPDMDIHRLAFEESEVALSWLKQMKAWDDESQYNSTLVTVDAAEVIQQINESRVSA